ncbi:MAG TPA: YIP1 family protein [Steroidobacteraceae bacterium]|nr:YIP1 family protein [Steroidobacteraceae bacterium]
MSTTEPIRPLKDVWLRPRRVFRELATRPIGAADYLLAASQGIATSIMVYRTQLAGPNAGTADILGTSFVFGPLGGVVSMYLFAAIYGRLGKRAGGKTTRNQVFHVLAYGGIPVAASLLVWMFTVLLVGESAVVERPGAEIDGFVSFVLRAQFASYMLLWLWSVVLQVMGFSEILGLTTRKAFGVWVLGQVVALLLYLFLNILIGVIFPGVVPSAAP